MNRPENAVSPPKGERIIWIDQVKGFAFFLVILGHLSLPAAPKSWIYSFHMPIFFFATGLNFKIDKLSQTSWKDFLLKLSKRMLIPYLWMQLLCMVPRYIVFALIKHKEVPVPTYLLGILTGNNGLVEAPSNPLYFVLLLFLAEVGLFALIKLTGGNRRNLWISAGLLLPFSLLSPNVYLPWHVNVVPAAMFMILLGTLLMKLYQSRADFLKDLPFGKLVMAAAVLLAVGALIWKFNGRFGLHGNRYGKDFFCSMLCAACSSAGIALVFMRLPKIRFLSYAGKNTLFFMGLHKPLLLLMEALFPAWKNKLVFVLCAAVVCFALLLPLTWAFEKLAPFVLGQNDKPGTPTLLGKMACVLGATCVPYMYFLNHFQDGWFKSGAAQLMLAVLLYAAACFVIFFVCRLLRFPFLMQKPTEKEAN